MNHGKLSGNIRKLKYQCSIRSMDNLIHKLWKNSRNFRKRAGDSLLPQEYYRLRMNRLVSYQETSLEQELNWGKNLLCLHADRLASFFKRKSRFENLVMQGYYPEAREELNAIQTECCFSLWGLEQEFLLQELEGGLEATKKFQNGLSFGCSNNWMNCFASFFSLKVERNLNNRIQPANPKSNQTSFARDPPLFSDASASRNHNSKNHPLAKGSLLCKQLFPD